MQIAENEELISQNAAKISENSSLISANSQAIKSLQTILSTAQEQISDNEKAVAENAVKIAENTSAIARNSDLIADNAEAIRKNADAIAANAASIEQLRGDLETAKTEITEAYQTAIATAISESEGKIRGELASEVAALNETVDTKIAQVNSAIETLTGRVDDVEDDIQEIKTAIYSIQTDIEEIQEQISQIMSRVQSVTFVPQYSDGRATMTYTNSGGVITPGTAQFDFAIRPASAAAELEKVWEEALSVRAVYTITRAVSFIQLQISEVSASDDGVLSLTVSGSGIDEGFFRGEKSMNAALVISDGNSEISSDFVNVVPWTTDNIYVPDANFKAYLVREFDIDGDGEISYEEAEAVEEINISASLSRIESLTGLDVAACEELVSLNCSHNSLSSLNVSGNTKLETLDCSENPALAKLWMTEAQDGSLALTKDETTEVFHNDGGVVIPDAALKAWLIGNYDDDGDGELSIAEADNVTLVNCSGRGVKDLTGLEACTNLETIDCSNNEISTIRLPRLTKLTTLRCYGNPVEVLDLTGCAALQALYLQDVSTNTVSGTSITVTGYDQAASLTFSVADTPFTSLTISGSGILTTLDVTANTQLVSLDCSGNTALQNIDVSSLSVLQSLNLNGCDLQSLDVTHNTALTTLLCNDNSIPALDVRNCTALITLECNTNALTSLNVTYNTLLQKLDVSSNSLQAVNVRSNPSLTWLDVSRNSAVNVLNVSNNPALAELCASGLSISDINLSANTALTYLDLSDNTGIAQLDLSANTALIYLDLSEISISQIDLSANTALTCLDLSGNIGIAQLDLSANMLLEKLVLVNIKEIIFTETLNDFSDRNLKIETSQYQCLKINEIDLCGFSDSGNHYLISCERSVEEMYWEMSSSYWKEQKLRLPTREEVEVIYTHKAELDAALSAIGYISNYFQTSDEYWTSSYGDSRNSHYCINMHDGNISSHFDDYTNPYYSFGVYVK